MISLFQNKIDRIIMKKEIIAIALVVIPLMIGIAILFTGVHRKEIIAYVTEGTVAVPADRRFQVVELKEYPPMSDLVLGKYSFIVKKSGNDSYDVQTLKNKSEKDVITNFFITGKIPDTYKSEDELFNERGVGTNILGFILMLVLMQGVALATLFPEDRSLKTFRRILSEPVSKKQYLSVHGAFIYICLYVPSYLAIILIKTIFHVDIGFSYLTLMLLMAVLTALATAFALFMSSIMDRNINLVTSGISIVTCVLAGCFIPFGENNKFVSWLCGLLPQKAFMTLVHNVEMGQGFFQTKGALVNIVVWIFVLWMAGFLVIRKRMDQGV